MSGPRKRFQVHLALQPVQQPVSAVRIALARIDKQAKPHLTHRRLKILKFQSSWKYLWLLEHS